MKIVIAALLAASIAGPASAQTINVGRANWSALPRLQVQRDLGIGVLVDRVEQLLKEGTCKLPGQSESRFDITVPFALLVEPNGGSNRVVVAETGCPELETMVGQVALLRAQRGHFRMPTAGKAKWYASEMNFNLQ
jgi:hypothetical protein